MAIRNTTLITKNSDIVGRPLPSSGLLAGEAIVNTADGIMWFSGVTTSSSEWTPAGTGTTESTFFEVGSNLYDLRLRNRITEYEGTTGAGLSGKFLSGTTNGFVLADITDIATAIDSYSTGGTYNPSTDVITIGVNNGKPSFNITGVTDNFTTGATLIGNTAYFNRNDSLSAYTLDLSSLDTNDTFVTGATYDDANTFTFTNNSGNTFDVNFDTVSGLTFSNLTSGRVVYVGSGGELTDEAGFTYNESTNTFEVANIETSQDVVIGGDLTVLGSAVSAFTGELYIEDNNVILNYNPTGTTNATSINSGFVVQDGDGASNDVSYNVVRMESLTGLTATDIPDITEYSAGTGYANRGWITELNDILIRSTNSTDEGTPGSITGVRVLAEFDTLDGGTF
jgi:hypothetical protein